MLDRNRPAATTITHDPPIHVRVVEWKRRPEPLPPSRRSVPKRSHPVRPGQTRRTQGSEVFEGRSNSPAVGVTRAISRRAQCVLQGAEPSAPSSPFVAHEPPARGARRNRAGTIDLSSVLPAEPGRRPRRTSPAMRDLRAAAAERYRVHPDPAMGAGAARPRSTASRSAG